MPQKCHSLHAITGYVQTDALIGGAKGFLRQPDVTGTVFDQENFQSHNIYSF
jgi:hypothetical protein